MSLILSLYNAANPLSVSVFPEVPVEGEPIIVTFNLKNPSVQSTHVNYHLFANSNMVMRGSAELAPLASKRYYYTYINPLEVGEQVTFSVRAASGSEEYEEFVSLPAYPPQVWTSFISFAGFSTSAMNYMATMAYYDKSFGNNSMINTGVIFSIILIGLLIYLELSEAEADKAKTNYLSLRTRFKRLSGVLFVIFIGMVVTQITLIIGRIG